MRLPSFLICFLFSCCAVAQQCERTIPIHYTYPTESINLCYTNHKWGAIDKSGKYCIYAQYDTLIRVPNYILFIAKKNHKYGVISSQGTEHLPFIYDSLVVNGGDFAARKDGKWAHISQYRGSNLFTEFKYDRVVAFGDDNQHLFITGEEIYSSVDKKIIIKQFQLPKSVEAWGPGEKATILLKKNKDGTLTPLPKSSITHLGNLYKVVDEHSTYYCTHSGKKVKLRKWMSELLPANYRNIFVVRTKSNHFGFVNDYFQIISDTLSDDATEPVWFIKSNAYPHVFWMKRMQSSPYSDSCRGGWMMYDENGKLLSDVKFLAPIDFYDDFSFNRATLFQAENRRFGLIDSNFNVVAPPVFDSVWNIMRSVSRELYVVKAKDKYGMLHVSGKLVVDTIFDYVSEVKGYYGDLYLKKGDRGFFFVADSLRLMGLQEYARLRSTQQAGHFFGELPDNGLRQYYGDMHTNSTTALYHCLKLVNQNPAIPLIDPFYFEYSGSAFRFYTECTRECWRHSYEAYTKPIRSYYLLYALDSSFISFSRADTLLEYFDYEYNPPLLDFNFNTITKEKFHFSNYAVRGDTIQAITLDSLFLKSDTLRQALHRRAMDHREGRSMYAPYFHLTEKFLLTGVGGIILFEEDSPGESGRAYTFAVLLSWNDVNDLIDPKGPLGKKIIRYGR